MRGEGPALECGRRRRPQANRDTGHAGGSEGRGSQGAPRRRCLGRKCGWDLSSYPPNSTDPKHIEIKGRVKGADTITVSRNEILYAFNQGEKFVLAIVFVNPDDSVEEPHYLTNPFQREPDWGAASVNYSVRELLKRAKGNS